MSLAIRIENLSKRYQLGLTHAGSVRDLVNHAASRLLGRSREVQANAEDPSRLDEEGMFWALQDIGFEIPSGEAIGIIGRNGAGKSTLLKILSRITHPTTGRIEMYGRVASLLEVGTGFHPELTGRENVYLNGTILGMTKADIRNRFDDIVQFAGVEKFIDTPVKRYSSGMTVRLGFAVAAHLDPEILIVDEVLAVGDVEFQQRCLGKMQSAARSGRTVLFVSHNLASIRTLTSRTIVLAGGRCVYDGPTERGIARYIQENMITPESGIRIEDAPRAFSGLDRRLEFVDLQLKGLDPEGCLAFDAPFQLVADVRAREACDDFVLSMTLYGEDKTPIGSTFSRPLHAPDPGGQNRFEFTAPFPLAPGKYHCHVSLSSQRSGGKHLHDSLSDVLLFEVSSPEMGQRIWDSSWGMIRLPDLEPVSTSPITGDSKV